MTPAQLTALKSEIQTDPAALGYAAYLPDAPGRVCALLNAISTTMTRSRFITARTILAECGMDGPAILDTLDAVAANVSAVKWAMRFLQQDSGIDIGHPATQAMLNQLRAAGALQVSQVDALKALAVQAASRAQVLGFESVAETDLHAAGAV